MHNVDGGGMEMGAAIKHILECFLQPYTVKQQFFMLHIFFLSFFFVLQTTPGDHVIDQGDDGDNFYVIDR